jgi:hypothetical protein
MRCKQCAVCSICKQKKSSNHFDDGKKECKSCVTLFTCEVCGLRHDIPEIYNVKKHMQLKNPIVCHPCRKKGFTRENTTVYQCVLCSQSKGHKQFVTTDLTVYKNTPTSEKPPLQCDDCKQTHARCSTCRVWRKRDVEGWSKDAIKNEQFKETRLLCRHCLDVGKTKRDPSLHLCEACKTKLARSSFETTQLNNKQKRTTAKLVCKDCTIREKQILEQLTPVSGEHHPIRLCTCKHRPHLPHEEKCKLYPRGFSGDNRISEEDLLFLRFRPEHVKKYNIPI